MEIEQSALDRIVVHARASRPDECCGILLARPDGRIVEAAETPNIAADPSRHFLIDPKTHIDVRREARQRGLAIAGFYHSHPHSNARPSATDLAEAAYPGSLYAIVGLAAQKPEIRFYRLENGNFRETPFVPVT